MENEVYDKAEQIKSAITDNAGNFTSLLIEFVRRYGDTSSMNEAVMLSLNLQATGETGGKEKYTNQAIALIEEVVRVFVSNPKLQIALSDRIKKLEIVGEKLKSVPVVVCEAEHLGKRYKGFEMNGVQITLRSGEITAIVGENANGKTTLLRMIAGDLYPDAGRISYTFDTSGCKDWETIKKNISYVPQQLPRWNGHLNDMIHYEAAIHGIEGKDNVQATDFIIHRLWLQEHIDKSWKELSGGIKMRFALARALVSRPKILVLDEPLAHLDIKAQAIVLDDLRRLADSLAYPVSIVISSQHLHEIEQIADRLIFIKNGKVAFNGPVDAIGTSRQENLFEFQTEMPGSGVLEKVHGGAVKNIVYKEGHFLITTERNITSNEILQTLIDLDIPITYFRDVSLSSKRFFQ